MEIIEITDEMELRARTMEAQVLLNLKSTPNYTGFSEKDRFYFGFLGELAFEQFLIKNKIPYTYDVKLDGNSQGTDFIIVLHRPLQLEIKTSGHPNAQNLMIPQKQFDHRSFDLYVGVKIIDKKAEIYGYCFKDQFGFAENGFNNSSIPTYFKRLDTLYPISQLVNTRNIIATGQVA